MEERFLEAIRADPDNTSLQLVYADWLDDQGELRGELIRLHVEVREDLRDHPHWPHYLSTLEQVTGFSDVLKLLALLDEKQQRLFACQCAESVLHFFEAIYPDDHRPRQAIETSRAYALGKVTKEQLDATREAAWNARQAAWNARQAAWASEDAAGIGREAAEDATWVAAWAAGMDTLEAAEHAAFAAGRAAGRATTEAAVKTAREAAVETAKAKQLTWVVSRLLGFHAER